MKKVLFLSIAMISSFCFATIQEEEFQQEILQSKVEQQLAYAGVKQALGEEYSENMSESISNHQDSITIKIVRLER